MYAATFFSMGQILKVTPWQQNWQVQMTEIPNNTLLIYFSEVGPVIFPETCLQA